MLIFASYFIFRLFSKSRNFLIDKILRIIWDFYHSFYLLYDLGLIYLTLTLTFLSWKIKIIITIWATFSSICLSGSTFYIAFGSERFSCLLASDWVRSTESTNRRSQYWWKIKLFPDVVLTRQPALDTLLY